MAKRRTRTLGEAPKRAVRCAPNWIRRLPTRALVLSGLFTMTIAILGGLGWHASSSGLVNRWVMAGEARIVDLTKATGLEVRDVMVVGRSRTKRAALLEAIGIKVGDLILSVDLQRVHSRVSALAWVKEARLERRLPDTIFVSLIEREPMALWQRDGSLYLIDLDGRVVPSRDVSKFSDLPIVIGDDAPSLAREVLVMLAGEPDLGDRVRAITWVGERRWDVQVDDRINIQLPEQDPHQAWAQLAWMEREHGVLRRDVITIDMRLRDQLVVRVAPVAAARKRDRGRDT
ncbi:MAG: FtsQ-type POTRA domain-containing protein [Alphaproteobacteria bacterium]|nr:FtsQ-type POTRA domain-containing protein [Alphaproteobacteria bacterium]